MERKSKGTLRNGFIDPVDVGAVVESKMGAYMPRTEANQAIATMQTDINSRAKSSALGSYATTDSVTAALAAAGVSAVKMQATLGVGGSVVLDFGKTYTTPPVVSQLALFVGNKSVWSVIGTVTNRTVTLTGRKSKGTLLLSDGPNEAAVAGDIVEVLVIGK